MWRKDGKPWISAIAIAVLFMAMAFVPGVSAKENLETSAVTAERAAPPYIGKAIGMIRDDIDYMLSLPYMILDWVEALFAVTLSEETVTSLFTGIIVVMESLTVFELGLIPLIIVEAIVYFVLMLLLIIPEIILFIVGAIAGLLTVLIPPWPLVGLGVFALIAILPMMLIMFIPLMAVGILFGYGELKITEKIDDAIGLSDKIGGILSKIYFKLSFLWNILYKIIGPIIGFSNKTLDMAFTLILEPLLGYLNGFFKDIYGY